MPGPKDTGYAAGVVIDKALTLDGGKLKSDGSDNVVDVTKNGDLTLTGGITITGGKPNPDKDGYSRGGGIYNDGIVDIKNAVITDNHADNGNGYGGGIENHKTLTMEGGSITGNTAVLGGGIHNLGENATFTLNGGEVGSHNSGAGNGAYNGGGILNEKGTVTLNGGTIESNTADNYGGGINNENGTVNLNGGSITGNTANEGGGISQATRKSTLWVKNSQITTEEAAKMFVYGNTAEHDEQIHFHS
jgi:hypothetical protein